MSPPTAVGIIALLTGMIIPVAARGDDPPTREFRAQAERSAEPTALPRPGRDLSSGERSKKKSRGSGSILRTLGALIFVVALIMVGGRFLRKHAPKLNGGIPAEAMELLGKRAIDQKQVMHLVRLGSRILVIGSSANGLQTLAEITDPVEVDYLAGMCRRDESESQFTQGFLALFRRTPTTEGDDNEPATEPSHADNDSPHQGVDDLKRRLSAAQSTAAEARHA